MGAFSDAELCTEIANIKVKIASINAAFATASDPSITRYKIDTGQSTQEVERRELDALYKTIPSLMNQAETLHARKTGSGGVLAWPVF